MGKNDHVTLFHEPAHAADARVNGKLKGAQDGQQETVAGLTAAILMELYGLRDHTGNAWLYIAHYHEDPLTAICPAVDEGEQIMGVLLAFEPERADAQVARLACRRRWNGSTSPRTVDAFGKWRVEALLIELALRDLEAMTNHLLATRSDGRMCTRLLTGWQPK